MKLMLLRFFSLLLCLLLFLSVFCVSAGATHIDFADNCLDELPDYELGNNMARSSLSDYSGYSCLYPYWYWSTSSGFVWRSTSHLVKFGSRAYPITSNTGDYGATCLRWSFGFNTTIDENNYSDLINLQPSSLNNLLLNVDSYCDYSEPALTSVVVTLASLDNGIVSTVQRTINCYETISSLDNNLSVNFNTSATHYRFVKAEFTLYVGDNGYYNGGNYLVINDLSLADNDTAEERNFFQRMFDNVLNAFTNLGDRISSFFTELANKIKGFFTDLANKIQGFFTDLANKIKGFFTDLFENIKRLFIPGDGFFENKLSELQEAAKTHLGFLYDVPSFVVGIFQSLIDHISNAGNNRILNYPALVFNGYTLIKAGSIDFGYFIDILEQHNIYTIYRIFVCVIASVWFINFAYRKFQNILGSVV